jgi:iron(III) transport system permease protein
MTVAADVLSPSPVKIAGRAISKRLPVIVLLIAVCFLVLMPLVKLQVIALDDGASAYTRAFSGEEIFEVLLMTLWLAVGSVIIATILGVLLAWCATLLPPKLAFLNVVPILPIVLPAAATIVGWAFLLSPRPGYLNALLRTLPWWSDIEEGPIDIYTMEWIVIITGLSLTSFMFLFVSNGMRNINTELIEAAQVAGSGQLGIFFKITVPLLRPVLVYGIVVVLLLGLGQFTGPLFLGRTEGIDVITTLMYRATARSPVDHAAAAALGSPLLIFGILLVIGQRLVLGDQNRFVTHSGKSFVQRARHSWVAVTLLVLFALFSTILPLIALIIVALSPYWSGTPDISSFTLEHFTTALATRGITDAIINSVVTSIAAAIIALFIGYSVSTLLLRGKEKHKWAAQIIDFVVGLPLAIPSVIFGVGFLLTYSAPPFKLYGTPWVLILVYVTLMLPFATRMILSGMVSLGNNYIEASRTSGAGVVQTSFRIMLPLLRPTIAGAGALIFILLTHEFSASLLVRSPTSQVMGTVLYDYWTNGMYPIVAAVALIMGLVTAAGLSLALILGGTSVLRKL